MQYSTAKIEREINAQGMEFEKGSVCMTAYANEPICGVITGNSMSWSRAHGNRAGKVVWRR